MPYNLFDIDFLLIIFLRLKIISFKIGNINLKVCKQVISKFHAFNR